MKIPNRQKFQQVSIDHSSGIDLEEVEKIYRTCIAMPFYCLAIDTILSWDNLLRENMNSRHNNQKNIRDDSYNEIFKQKQ